MYTRTQFHKLRVFILVSVEKSGLELACSGSQCGESCQMLNKLSSFHGCLMHKFTFQASSTLILRIQIKTIGASARNSTFRCGVHSTQ